MLALVILSAGLACGAAAAAGLMLAHDLRAAGPVHYFRRGGLHFVRWGRLGLTFYRARGAAGPHYGSLSAMLETAPL